MTSTLLRDSASGQVSFRDEWQKIRPIILNLLHQKDVGKADWQGLFFSVHSMCSWVEHGADLLLQRLQAEIRTYVDDANQRIRTHHEENALLRAYINEWSKFYTQTAYLPLPFMILEQSINSASATQPQTMYQRSHAASNSKPQPKEQDSTVRKCMLETWNTTAFTTIREQLQNAALKLVGCERAGESIDTQLVVGVRESYVHLSTNDEDELHIYRNNFERSYLDATEEFYRCRASQVLADNGVQNYMQYADEKLMEEESRGQRYLDTIKADSLTKLLDRCVRVLVVCFQEQILAECAQLIKHNQVQKLRQMYRLLNRTSTGIQPMLDYLDAHIRGEGLADMVQNAHSITTDSEKYVDQLLSMFNRFSTLVRDAFYDDPRFLTARDKAFQDVINDVSVFKLDLPVSRHKGGTVKVQPESKCPELLATYCDLLLRKTPLSKKLSSEEVDAKLNDVLLVLKYVQNKDVFMRFHKTHLARRLILDMSADQEKEETMVNRLRECGMPADYVNKLYRMLQDIEVNKDINKLFKSQLYGSNNNKNTVADTVNVKILNAGAWSRGSERTPVRHCIFSFSFLFNFLFANFLFFW